MITEALIEKATDGGLTFIEQWKPYKLAKFKKENPSDYAELKAVFGAALLAVLPDVVEECAKVADQYNFNNPGAAIRLLAKENEEAHG